MGGVGRGGLVASVLASGSSGPGSSPGARFSKALETLRARSLSVSENGDTPETSCVKRTSIYIKNA